MHLPLKIRNNSQSYKPGTSVAALKLCLLFARAFVAFVASCDAHKSWVWTSFIEDLEVSV